MKAVSFYMIHNLLYETKVTGVTNLLKPLVKIRSFSMGYRKHEQKKYIVRYKTSVGWDMQYNVNGRTYYCIIFQLLFFYYFHKLLLSTNEVLHLQKQPLVGTLQKPLLLISTNVCSFMITAENYLFFVEHFCSHFGIFFGGEGRFNHFQALNTSTKF